MRRLLQLALLLLAVGAVLLHAGEVIDRVAVTVNSAAILQSDVDVAVRCESLLDGRPSNTLATADQQAVLQRLIDQELLRQQMGAEFAAPRPEEVAERLRQVRTQIAASGPDEAWRKLLAEYGLSEADVTERLSAQIQISRFLEQRLRPSVRVDQASILAYYNEQFLPQLKKSGGLTAPSLRDVRSRIQEILLQQRMDEELSAWLRSLRQQARIRIFAEQGPVSAVDGHAGPGGNGK